jgi:hypothetical protein
MINEIAHQIKHQICYKLGCRFSVSSVITHSASTTLSGAGVRGHLLYAEPPCCAGLASLAMAGNASHWFSGQRVTSTEWSKKLPFDPGSVIPLCVLLLPAAAVRVR